MRNREKFVEDVGMMNAAAIGIFFVRTREPLRAKDALREYAYVNKKEYKEWSMLSGWGTFDKNNSETPPSFDSEKDLYKALDKIANVSGTAPINNGSRSTGFDPGFFTVLWPHFVLHKVPAVIQVILELATICIQEKKRIAMIIPPHFDIPAELTDVVPIVDFELPSSDEIREEFVNCIADMKENERLLYTDEEIDRVTNALTGMTGAEAEAANARAIVKHKRLLPNIPVDKFCETLLAVKTEALKRSDVLELMPPAKMTDIGGLGELKAWVRKRKSAFGAEARAANVDRPRGFLVVGPPGNGKSVIAKATASELGLSLIKFDISRVYSGLVGSSEAKVRNALKTIEAMAPAVVLVDEIDKAVGVNSSTNDSGVSTRILGAILTFMQESTAEVFWVITANRATNLPSELVRKGRLDEVWSALTPSEAEIEEIMGIHLRKRGIDPASVTDLSNAVVAAAGYVGAEIEAAISEAKLTSYGEKRPVTGEMITEHLRQSKPLSEAFAEDFSAMEQWAANNARPASLAASENAKARTQAASPRVRNRNRMSQVNDVGPSTGDLDG